MSTYSGPQPPQKYEHTKSDGGGHTLEGGIKPGATEGGESCAASGGKLSAVTAGHSSKIPGGPAFGKGGNSKGVHIAGKSGE